MSSDTVELEGYVGPISVADGLQDTTVRLGNQGEVMLSEVHPQWAEHLQRGNAFVYSTAAAGVTWLAPTGTQNMPMLWNPAGSRKNFWLKRIVAGYVSGDNVPGTLELAFITNAGAQIGTAAPIVSHTLVAGVNLYLGHGNTSVMRFAPAAEVVTTAPTFLCPLGISHYTGLATTATRPFVMDTECEVLVPPSVAIFVVINTVSTVVGSIALYGLEVPIPPTIG